MFRLKLCFIFFSLTTAANAYWFLTQLRLAAVGTGGEPTPAVCSLIPGLSRSQRRLCDKHPGVTFAGTMIPVGDGAKEGIRECQYQFRTERWNCTTVARGGTGKILVKLGSRESAFVYAISSAGVVHSLARACSAGSLTSCTCATGQPRGTATDKSGARFTWGGCGDNVRYAADFARRFIDGSERKKRDGRALMNLHNNRVGRKVIRRRMTTQCKCHGISGACTTKTCWQSVPQFRYIGEHLHKRYRRALQVAVRTPGKGGLVPARHVDLRDQPINTPSHSRNSRVHSSQHSSTEFSGKKSVKKSALVFFEPSPDYCVTDKRIGTLGTAGRQCNKNSTGSDSCDLLCCGRGYDTKTVTVKEKCQCKFVWCCRVECKTCSRTFDIHTCKGRVTSARPLSFLSENNPSISRNNSSPFQGRRRLVTPERFAYASDRSNSPRFRNSHG